MNFVSRVRAILDDLIKGGHFWLLGSVATATFAKVGIALVPILGGTVLLLLRWRINVLSLGDEDAASLGVRPGVLRWVVLSASALVVAGAVAVSGVVSWVGLVIPHLARMWVGPDHRILLPVSFGLGAAYLIRSPRDP
ncbi:MAG: iron chelate uptake ABC transporter family permease subunit [Ornithinimicrobium sp.]|uniref:iron chelate uptake ABC transporter family permease subunit n=1 Tax=Ornithinimicrobium sp. TaxID=1977084 RepID=UPI003D9B3642